MSTLTYVFVEKKEKILIEIHCLSGAMNLLLHIIAKKIMSDFILHNFSMSYYLIQILHVLIKIKQRQIF